MIEYLIATMNSRITKKAVKRMIGGLSIICLILIIKHSMINNCCWLEGSWEAKSETYTFTAKDDHYTKWKIAKDGHFVLKDGGISVTSRKNDLLVVDNDGIKQYEATRINRNTLRLTVSRKNKIKKTVLLTKR